MFRSQINGGALKSKSNQKRGDDSSLFFERKNMGFRLCTIDTKYIEFLRSDRKLYNVFENKDDANFIRKYIGIVFNIGQYHYYAPLSSPKRTDYKVVNGKQIIRNDIIPIIRIVAQENEEMRLKGTVKLSNMIPVPEKAIFDYDIEREENEQYKALIEKEYAVLKQKERKILKNAELLYRQKTKEDILYSGENANKKPGYLSATINFKYAEQMHDKYISEHA